MNQEQETHLSGIKSRFCTSVDEKYRKGQKEHGGDLWKKPGLFPMLKDETTDFIVYADTLEQQLREILALLATYDKTIMALGVSMLKDLLDGPTD
jgi:hypothetical protein